MENSRFIVGAEQKPDGSWDTSRAMVMLSREESMAVQQRTDVINGKLKHQIDANPDAIVLVEEARKYWNRRYEEALTSERLEMQINEIYAQKYEGYARFARQRMQELEQQLTQAETEEQKQAILRKIVEERELATKEDHEAHLRRGYEC